MNINKKIALLREAMQEANIAAYIIPSSDAHQSEYVADHWKSREWISGFTGSAGTAVVTMDNAGVWTDSRYFISAVAELANSEFELHKLVNQGQAEYVDYLISALTKGAKIACDGRVISKALFDHLNKKCKAEGMELNGDHDLIHQIWTDRPGLPSNKIFAHDIKYAGRGVEEKLNDIREEMKRMNADYHLINTLDDIAWTFNIRGKDVECNPVAICYSVITKEEAFLFIQEDKVPAEVAEHLKSAGVHFQDYQQIENFLATLSSDASILVDPSTTSQFLWNKISSERIIKGDTIPMHLKAIKNETEIEHLRNVMIKDGLALCEAFMWLEKSLENGSVDECDVSEKFYACRKAQGKFHGESFNSIIGYKGNGAIVHYRPAKESCAQIKREGILLTDSGGQYEDGTTDITRTIALGPPTEEQIRNNTLVLKGHIGLAMAVFPEGTRGVQLDLLARQHLWKYGLNYLHGTGHGVGFFLNVHEPPQGFAPSISMRGKTSIKAGMFTSNEPGYYKEDEYGIRIENCVITVKAEEHSSGNFLKFDTITLFPIDQQLIDKKMLTEEELGWLNSYHEEVYEKLSPGLDEEGKNWLKEKCKNL